MRGHRLAPLFAALALVCGHQASAGEACGVGGQHVPPTLAETAVLAWSRTVAESAVGDQPRQPQAQSQKFSAFEDFRDLAWFSGVKALSQGLSQGHAGTIASAIKEEACIVAVPGDASSWRVEIPLRVYPVDENGWAVQGIRPKRVLLLGSVWPSDDRRDLRLRDVTVREQQ